jgi:uncharacterized protein with PQ loop repeat
VGKAETGGLRHHASGESRPRAARVTAAAFVGAIGVVLNQVFIWPQVLRARRTVEGIAVLTVLSGLVARALWAAYGVALDDLALICGNVTVATGFLILAFQLSRADVPWTLPAGVVGIAAVALLTVTAGESILGWVAVIAAAVVNLPQMLRALTDQQQLDGVSVTTYLLIAAASCSWLVYGALVREPLIAAPHVVLLPTALVTAWLAWRSQRRFISR